MWTFRTGTHDFLCAFIDKHNAPIQSSFTRAKERPGLCGCFWLAVWKFFFFFWFARTATHVRARESKGTACVVVVSGTRFERDFFFCTYGHARMGTHVRARESEGTACVVVVSGVTILLLRLIWHHNWRWGPEYVPFQGLILIGQVVPKLWPFIYQTNDRTRCYDVTIDMTIIN